VALGTKLGCWLFVGTLVLLVRPAKAEESSACVTVTRENVARCVVEASAAVRADREAAAAAMGRRTAASPWLPSNPVLSVSLARRAGTDGKPDAINYNAALSQELELAG
jgi:hypothetical protein